MTWVLIITMWYGMYGGTASSLAIPRYETKAACESAARAALEAGKDSMVKMVFCIPGPT